MRAKEVAVVYCLGGDGVIKPFLQPVQWHKLIGLACKIKGHKYGLESATHSEDPPYTQTKENMPKGNLCCISLALPTVFI